MERGTKFYAVSARADLAKFGSLSINSKGKMGRLSRTGLRRAARTGPARPHSSTHADAHLPDVVAADPSGAFGRPLHQLGTHSQSVGSRQPCGQSAKRYGDRVPRLLLVMMLALTACHPLPKHRVKARVVDIYSRASRRRPDQLIIVFQTRGGLMEQRSMPMSDLRCAVGDTVDATAQGISLQVAETACRAGNGS